MNKEYKTSIYKARKGFLYFILLFIIIIAILLILGKWLNTPLVAILGFISLCILPFYFKKKIDALFTRDVILEFDDISFIIRIFNFKKQAIINQFIFKWADIKSYKVYFSSSKNIILTIHLKDGTNKTWGFKDGKTEDEAIAGESVFNIFHSFVKKHNFDKTPNNIIVYSSGYLSSRFGMGILACELILFIIAIVFHLFKHPQSSILTLLLGLSFFTQQLIKRKKEKRLNIKIRDLDKI